MRRISLRHRLEYLVFRLFAWVIVIFSERLTFSFCGILGWLGGVVFRIRRSDVDSHLAIAFPEQSISWRNRIARRSYQHFAWEMAMTLRLSWMHSREVLKRTDIKGLEDFLEAVKAGKGVVIVSGHLGNWEVAGASLAAMGVPLDVVAYRQKNLLINRYFMETRNRLGFSVIIKNEAFPLVSHSLSTGRVVAFVADQNVRKRGILVDFFDRPSATAKGPALFALRNEAPVFFATAVRALGWPPRYELKIEKVLVSRNSSYEEAILKLTQCYTSILEQRIREYPEQYLWQHRRWKEYSY
jgi:KDO2-lipid IV(A) lauroyltransferase